MPPPPDRTQRIDATCELPDAPWNPARRGLPGPLGVDESRAQRNSVIVQRLVTSALALRCLLALSQRPQGVRTAELAAFLGAPYSSAERALELLIADDLVERTDRRSRLVDSPSAAEAVRFGLSYLPAVDAIEALARANPAAEFCGADSDGVLLVVRRFAVPADEAGLVRTVEVLRAFHPDRRIELAGKAELRDRLLDDLSPRRRAQAMRVLAGGVDRTFPDRTRHGDLAATGLGRLHPTLPAPSQRRLRELARRHRLRRILAFGSATRADFRPDSDLDLLVEPLAGYAPGLRARVEMIADAEDLFGRDVDLLTAPVGRPSLAARIAREAVVLYDAAR
jgi:predicted nucleotidyltransferase